MQFNHNVYYTEKPAMWEKNMKSVLNWGMLAKMSSDWKKKPADLIRVLLD